MPISGYVVISFFSEAVPELMFDLIAGPDQVQRADEGGKSSLKGRR